MLRLRLQTMQVCIRRAGIQQVSPKMRCVLNHLATCCGMQAQCIRRHMYDTVVAVHKDVDVLVCPTLPMTAPRKPRTADIAGESNLALTSAIMRFAQVPNFLGLPAATVPAGWDDTGLPTGCAALSNLTVTLHDHFVQMPWSLPNMPNSHLCKSLSNVHVMHLSHLATMQVSDLLVAMARGHSAVCGTCPRALWPTTGVAGTAASASARCAVHATWTTYVARLGEATIMSTHCQNARPPRKESAAAVATVYGYTYASSLCILAVIWSVCSLVATKLNKAPLRCDSMLLSDAHGQCKCSTVLVRPAPTRSVCARLRHFAYCPV